MEPRECRDNGVPVYVRNNYPGETGGQMTPSIDGTRVRQVHHAQLFVEIIVVWGVLLSLLLFGALHHIGK